MNEQKDAPNLSTNPPLTAGQRLEAARAKKAAEKAKKLGKLPATEAKALEQTEHALSWLGQRKNGLLIGSVTVIVVIAVSFAWMWRRMQEREAAGNILAKAVKIDERPVGAAPAFGQPSTAKPFATAEAKRTALLKAYRRVIKNYSHTEALTWALLGEGSVLLQQSTDYPPGDAQAKKKAQGIAEQAFKSYSRAKSLAKEPSVTARALEGMGIAKQNQEKFDEALSYFEQMLKVRNGEVQRLAELHVARTYLLQGKRDKAQSELKKLIHQLTDRKQGADVVQMEYVLNQAQTLLASIDPSLVKNRGGGAFGGGNLDPAQIQRILEQLKAGQGAPE